MKNVSHISNSPFRGSGSKAFTLAEMMMAIALSAMLIVTVFGVMGTAQVNVNRADTKSTQARIAQVIVSEILLNDWSSILEYDGTDRFYDSEGIPVERSGTTSGNSMWAYRARIDVKKEQAEIPGTLESGTGKTATDHVMSRRVIVRITNGYFPEYDFVTGTRHRNFPTWVARTDKM